MNLRNRLIVTVLAALCVPALAADPALAQRVERNAAVDTPASARAPAARGQAGADDPVARILSSVSRQLENPEAPFTLAVDIHTAPGQRRRVAELYAAHAAVSRREQGVGPYEIGRVVGEDDVLLLYETYVDLATFERHVRAAHTQRFLEQSAGMIERRIPRLVLDVTRSGRSGGATE